MDDWARPDGADTLLDVWVVPGASRTEVVGPHGSQLKIRVSDPPEGGRATRAVVALVERRCQASVLLESGESSRRKRLRVMGVAPADVRETLLS